MRDLIEDLVAAAAIICTWIGTAAFLFAVTP